jgi:hypothetical protein
MKFFKKTIVAALLAISMIVPNSVAFAAGVTVTLNGAPLKFTLIDPLIINDRAMVPIRETAEFLGMTVDWDQNSGTMTCTTKEGDVVKHTLYQSMITVNGVQRAFDTPSQTVNDRTVMPVRMLAEAIGAKVDWNGTTSTVIIVKDNAPVPATPTTPATPNTQMPIISSVATGTANASAGNAVTFNVIANTSAERIQVLSGATGMLLANSGMGSVSGATKTFTVSFTPTNNFETMMLNFLPIGSNGVSGPVKTYNLKGTVPGSSNTIGNGYTANGLARINKVTVDDSSISLGDTVEVTVMTNNQTEKVAIFDVNRNTLASTSHFYIDGNERRFELEIEPVKTGNVTMDVEATGRDNKKVTDEFDLSVTRGNGSSSSDDLIIDYDFSDTSVEEGEEIEVELTTEDTVERVWIEIINGDNEVVEIDDYEDESGNERTWEFTFDAEDSGFYKLCVEDDDGNEAFIVERITVDDDEDYLDEDYEIYDYEVEDSNVNDGDDIEISVTTGIGAESIEVEFEDGDSVYSVQIDDNEAEFEYDDDRIIWTIVFEADADLSGEYTIISESYEGSTDEVDGIDIEIDE